MSALADGARRLPMHHITIRVPKQGGGGEAGTLIETRDELSGALDAAAIAQVIQEVPD